MIDGGLISGIVGGGLSLLGGIFGSKAAKKAGDIQAAQARASGQNITDTVQQINPQITAAAARSGDRAMDTAWSATTGVNNAATAANEKLDQANAGFSPYTQAGAAATSTLQQGLVPGGDFNKTPTMADLQIDPGYEFRRQQGQKALARRGSAEGGALGGGKLMELNQYNSDLASTEYGKAFQRFRDSVGDRFSNLFKVSGQGLDATKEVSGNLAKEGTNLTSAAETGGKFVTRASEYAGTADTNAAALTSRNTLEGAKLRAGLDTDAAAAQAGGIVGAHNAAWGGITGAAGQVTSGLRFSQLLKNPSAYNGGINPLYARNPLGGGMYGAGPVRP